MVTHGTSSNKFIALVEFIMSLSLMVGVGYLMGALGVASTMFESSLKANEIIDKVLLANNIGIKTAGGVITPQFLHSDKHNWGIRYVYTLPSGITSEEVEKVTTDISEALDKDINITFRKYLYIDVFKEEFSKDIPYQTISDGYKIAIGVDRYYKPVYLDFSGEIPHVLGAGATRFGKSVFLRGILTSVLLTFKPILYLSDLKGGVEFKLFKEYATGFAKDLYQLANILSKLQKEMYKRLDEMERTEVQIYQGKPILLVMDELVDLVIEGNYDQDREIKKSVKSMLRDLAAKGGATRIQLVLFTQSPYQEILEGLIKLNMNTRISFKQNEPIYSDIIMNDSSAYDLPKIKGRAIYRDNEGDKIIQVYNLPYDKAKTLLESVEKVTENESADDESGEMEGRAFGF